MGLHVKKSGMMIAGKVLEETGEYWVFHANDEKRKKKINKDDDKQTIFTGETALDDAYEWLSQFHRSIKDV